MWNTNNAAGGGDSTLRARMSGPKFHPVTKSEKTQIWNLCLNHLFLEAPFLKPISTFYHVNWDA